MTTSSRRTRRHRDARPIHLRPRSLLLVLVGGTFGTAAREALSLAFPPVDGVSYAVLGANVVGALLLGILLEALAHGGPDRGRASAFRLLAGTGFMGGFTTYSSLATDSARLIGADRIDLAVVYAVGTLVLGAAATWAGIMVAATHRANRAAH